MKVTKKDIVYRHKGTGVAYTLEHTIVPIAVMVEPGKPALMGALLKPYGDHPDIDWDDWSQEGNSDALQAQYGFLPNRYGQWIVVEEAKLETDFECLGTLTKEMDLEALTRHYEEEHCSFSNKEQLAKAVIRRLSESVLGSGPANCMPCSRASLVPRKTLPDLQTPGLPRRFSFSATAKGEAKANQGIVGSL